MVIGESITAARLHEVGGELKLESSPYPTSATWTSWSE